MLHSSSLTRATEVPGSNPGTGMDVSVNIAERTSVNTEGESSQWPRVAFKMKNMLLKIVCQTSEGAVEPSRKKALKREASNRVMF